jgi:hypothetical protein
MLLFSCRSSCVVVRALFLVVVTSTLLLARCNSHAICCALPLSSYSCSYFFRIAITLP